MSTAAAPQQMVKPPARALRLLANLWLPTAILFGLVTIGLVSTTIQSFMALVTQASEPNGQVAGYILGVLVSGFAAVVLGRITWRLAIEVPRTVRSWEEALVERRTVVIN